MLGAIIGDIVGSRFEFNPTGGLPFELFTPQCDFTDDTICTVAIADALLSKEPDYKSSLVKWCKRYNRPMGGYGASFARWIDNPVPYWSYGNGAVMRISPIGLLLDDLRNIFNETVLATAISHNHEDAIRHACAVSATIYNLKHGMSKEAAISKAAAYLDLEKLPEFIPQSNPFNETVYNCVPVAFSCLFHSTDFESAIRNAIEIGGDVDTIGACVGGMAEALYGIPAHIKERAMEYLPDDMKEVVTKFYERYGQK